MNEFNLEEFLQANGIKIEHDDGKSYRIRCINPAHNDSSPSMGVLKEFPHGFNCLGCGTRGSVFQFVKLVTGKSLSESYDLPAKVDLEFKKTIAQSREEKFERKIFQLEESSVLDVYENRNVMRWLKRTRGCSDNFIQHFKITWAKKIKINDKYYYNRVLVPVYENKKLVTIELRDFTGMSKVKVLYPKQSKSDCVFNGDNIDKKKTAYFTEGIFDTPKLWEIEKNCGALLGASLGANQIKYLNTVPGFVLIPDNDEAGHNLIMNLDELLDVDFYIAFLPSHIKDPGAATKEQIRWAIDNKIHILDYIKGQVGYEKKKPDWGCYE